MRVSAGATMSSEEEKKVEEKVEEEVKETEGPEKQVSIITSLFNI